MKRKTILIPHVEDHSVKVYAKGKVSNGYFKGEYKHKGMTYGVEIKYPLQPLKTPHA